MKKSRLRFRTAECAKKYRDLFEQWRDFWTPKVPFRMIAWAASAIFLSYAVLHGIGVFISEFPKPDPFFHAAGWMIMGAFVIFLTVHLWWSDARDAKRLRRINRDLGTNYEDLDEARIGALRLYFGRSPDQFRSLASELHQLTTLQAQYGLRSAATFKRILYGIFDPTGKQRVIALLIATFAIVGAVMVRTEGAEDGLMKLLSIGPGNLFALCILAGFTLWIISESIAFLWRQLEKAVDRADLTADAGKWAAIQYVIRDLLILEGATTSPSHSENAPENKPTDAQE